MLDRPHRYPPSAESMGVVLAWRCAECGEWQDDAEPASPCPGVGEERTDRDGTGRLQRENGDG